MTTSERDAGQDSSGDGAAQAEPHFIQAVDQLENARDLDEAARQAGIVADVVIDVAIGTRSGVPARRSSRLAGAVCRWAAEPEAARADQLRRQPLSTSRASTRDASRPVKRFEASVEAFERMKRAGLSTEIFSVRRHRHLQHSSRACAEASPMCRSAATCSWTAEYLDIGGETNEKVFDDFAAVCSPW